MTWRRRVLVIVVASWSAWLLLANLFLLPGVGPALIARHPERFHLAWDRAWSLAPCLAHVRGFECGGHVRNRRWEVEVEKGRVLVNLPALALRTFHGLWPRASGVRVRVETTDDYLPPRARVRPGFTVRLSGADVDDLAPLELAGYMVDGLQRVRGSFMTQARGPMEVPRALVRVAGGRIRRDDAVLADLLDLDVDARIARYVPREHRGEGPLQFLSGRATVAGRLGDLGILERFLRNTPMLQLEGGGATVSGELCLDSGRLVAPTAYTVSDASYRVEYLDSVVAEGTGRVLGGRATGTDDEALRVELDDFRLSRPDAMAPFARGSGLSIRVLAEETDLRHVRDRVALAVEIPAAELLDLGAFDAYLPERGGLHLLGGHGELSSRLLLDLRSNTGDAWLAIDATEVAAELHGRRVEGDLVVRADLEATDARQRLFGIRKLELTLDEFAVEGERRHRSTGATGGWTGRVDVLGGTLRMVKPLELDAEVELTALDARPILALAEERSRAVAWVDRLIRTDGLRGQARITTVGGPLAVRGLELTAGRAAVSGELCLERGRPSMLLLLALGDHHVGLERGPHGSDWHLAAPTRWFVDGRPAFSCIEASP